MRSGGPPNTILRGLSCVREVMGACLVGPARHGRAHASGVTVLRSPTLGMTSKKRQEDTRAEYRTARPRVIELIHSPRYRACAHLISLYSINLRMLSLSTSLAPLSTGSPSLRVDTAGDPNYERLGDGNAYTQNGEGEAKHCTNTYVRSSVFPDRKALWLHRSRAGSAPPVPLLVSVPVHLRRP